MPTGYRAVLKAATVVNRNAAARSFGLQVDATHFVFYLSVAGGSVPASNYTWDGWVALNEGQTLSANINVSGPFDINIGGYLYPLTL